MKTTIEMSPPLFEALKQVSKRENVTLRSLVEDGVRKVLEERAEPQPPFRLREASFGEGGLQPEFQEASWEAVREAIYEGRGS
jgi:hypothetical protein